MKVKKLWFARIGLAILIGGSVMAWDAGQNQARADVSVSVGLDIHSRGDFYAPLAPYGAWVDVGHYGRCWHPAHIVAGWRPYTVGYWEWTDCGWYWMSDEPWAWACCHYGYWVPDSEYGWVWVPGTDWAPAWVVWRDSPDYIGWAPCGPGGVAVVDTSFVFVDVHHFHDRFSPRSFIVNDSRIVQRTHLVRNFQREDRDFGGVRRTVFANPGPGLDPIQRATGTRFTPRPVTDVVRQTPIPEAARRGLTQRSVEQPRGNERLGENERPREGQRALPPTTGREQQRLYREAPPAQPAPTGRQEQRLYREAPNPARAQPQRPETQPAPEPRRQQIPEATPKERAVPPGASDRTRPETQVSRREEAAPPRRGEPVPRVAPAPEQHRAAPAQPVPPGKEKQRERDGQ